MLVRRLGTSFIRSSTVSATVAGRGISLFPLSIRVGRRLVLLWSDMVVRFSGYQLGCIEGRFRQGVNLRAPRSEAVRRARG